MEAVAWVSVLAVIISLAVVANVLVSDRRSGAVGKMMTGEAPVFTKYIFPTLASIVFLGIALASIGVGVQIFRWGMGI